MERDETILRDSEVALMDALKTAFDVMMYAGIKSAVIDKLLASQQAQYPPADMPRAVWLMGELREFVNDRARAEHREQRRQILEEPPAGSG